MFGGIGVGYGHRTTTAANSCNNTLHRRSSQSDRDRDRDRDRGTRSPAAASHGSGSSSLRMRAANRHAGSSSPPPRIAQSSSRHAALDHPRSDSRLFDPNGVDTVSNADGGMTPGSAFDASEIDRFVTSSTRPLGQGSSTVVKRTPHNREVVGSIPARC